MYLVQNEIVELYPSFTETHRRLANEARPIEPRQSGHLIFERVQYTRGAAYSFSGSPVNMTIDERVLRRRPLRINQRI